MKTKRIAGLRFFVISVLLLTACDSLRQEIDPNRLTTEAQKLVVSCFIAPGDTAVVVRVSRSQSVVGTTTPGSNTVTNALVTFSSGNQSVTLRHTLTLGGYNGGPNYAYSEYRALTTAIPIRVNQTYRLRVEVPGSPAVEAECTVPAPVAITSVTLDSAVITDFGPSRTEYSVRLRWTDPAGQANFYRVAGQHDVFYTARITQPNAPPRDTLIQSNSPVYFDDNLTISDVGRDGQEMISGRGRLGISYAWINGQPLTTRPVGRLEVYLLNADENYYRYHDAVQRQRNVDGNPFAEPVPIPTNMPGGLGCFGAYNRSTLTTELK